MWTEKNRGCTNAAVQSDFKPNQHLHENSPREPDSLGMCNSYTLLSIEILKKTHNQNKKTDSYSDLLILYIFYCIRFQAEMVLIWDSQLVTYQVP